MAIETNTNLVGKTIVLLDGTKTKITDAIASGYKVKSRTARVSTRCVVKDGAHFREIERMNMSQLEDTGEGYVKVKDAKATKSAKTAKAEKPAKTAKADKKPAKPSKKDEPAPKVRSKKEKEAKQQDDYLSLATAIIKGGKKVAPVEIEATDAELTDAIAKRLVSVLENTEIARVAADNKTPIANAIAITYGAEFAEEANVLQITLNLQYAKPVVSAPAPELDEAVARRAAKLASKKVGKVLAKAIKTAFDLEDANDLLPGTILLKEAEEFIFCGESVKHEGKALLYRSEGDRFMSVSSVTLNDFELVMQEEEIFDAPLEEEEEEEIEEEEEEEIEEEEADDSDAYSYIAVDKDQLALVNKKVTAKYHAATAERFGVSEEALVPGLVVTDGDTTFAYLGFDSKGGMLVIDNEAEDQDVLCYSKADIKSLVDFSPVVGEEEEEADADDEEDLDDEEEADSDDEEEEADDDFDFGSDIPSEDLEDLTADELRDRVVHLGLSTQKKADRMDEDELRALLTE